MDMSGAYIPIAKRLFPNAKIVLDRFHIIHRDKLYLLPDFQWILQKVVSYSSLTAINKDGYGFVYLIILRHKSQFPFLEPKLIPGHNSREFVIMFLESKLIKLTIDSGRRHAKSSCNIS